MADLQLIGRPDAAIVSTSTDLVPVRSTWGRHDVNGYYRALGVRPDATRRQLMDAYLARDGQNDAYLTYVFRQLLDVRTRARYDAAPLGQPFQDRYVHDEILRLASLQASAQNAAHGTETTAADILKSHGISSEEPTGEFLDSAPQGRFSDDGKRDRQPSPSSPATWSYSYLLLASTCDDESRMAQWREGLGKALAARNCPRFAVGFHGIPGRPFFVAKDLGPPVVFLHEDQPVTEELIAAAATAAVG
ncbi:hypothetical protein QFZ75_007939 [Streptomyces sp. V3I8]|uniref:hypothetical protein n=1 Tax=Streptomyces sp. V3I8 TaxID=3042279 RepID=UPI00277EA556|nr:hypothetical protein [Streptomyces sp. V3I8]MDQ1041437.1 hypothetical protein [Streptomyces sp. V3I8]